MTQSPKIQKPKRKEKLSDKEQSERFKEAALSLVVTGDGDGLSIGGNHTIHLLRRNFDVNILLFNNQIYGLTKGQYSPTSEESKVTKSTPMGSIDHPFNPLALALGADAATKARIMKLDRTELCDATVGGFDLVVSRTGYTGEKLAFELFVHPEQAADLWNAILRVGEAFGVKSVGLGARDSLRTEAGLPLYGHEMGLGSGAAANAPDLGVAEGGFGSYVKLYKPWFIGRDAYIANEKKRKGVVVRFRFDEQRVRVAHNGDPVVNAEGQTIGWVTSCAVDSDRFLTGLAYVEKKYVAIGTVLGIHQGKSTDKPATSAKVVSRFPKL